MDVPPLLGISYANEEDRRRATGGGTTKLGGGIGIHVTSARLARLIRVWMRLASAAGLAGEPSRAPPSPGIVRPMAAPRWTGSSGALAIAGVLGGFLYLTGDFLFYGQLGSGEAFRSLPAMAQRSDAALIAGGVVAPLASAGYVLGTLAMALAIRARHPRLAAAFFVSWTGMFLVGIAYHTVYTTRGFAAKLGDPAAADQTLGRIGALLSTLYAAEAALGAVGTLALAAAVLRGESGYPRWILLLMPTAWALAGSIARALPAPIGSVIVGGWTNGWFTVFFLAALATAARRGGPG